MMMVRNRLAISCPQIGIRSETFIRRHIEGLCPAGAAVVVNKPIPIDEETWAVDCPVYRANNTLTLTRHLQRIVGGRLGRCWGAVADRKGITKFLQQQRIGILLAEYLDDAWPLMGLARDLGIRFFAHAHGYDLSSFFRDPQWRKRYAEFHRADGVIVVNHMMKERLVSLGLSESKVHIIPCGVDVPEQPLKRPDREGIRCLAVGRMVAKKAPLKLLEAFCEACKTSPGLHLDYVGTGPLSADVERFIRQSGLENRVTLHGGQPSHVVQGLMAEADLFLQHSMVDPATGDEEGMPVAIQEAMAMSLPVIATRHAGIPDAVLHDKTGFLVAEGDVRGMTDYIVQLTCEPELRKTMGVAAWSHAREKLSWQREKEALQSVLGL